MRSKIHRREAPLPPPERRLGRDALVVLVLLVVGAGLALSAERLLVNTADPATAVSSHASPPPSSFPSPTSESGVPTWSPDPAAASDPPSASPSPAAPELEAEMPHVVNGTTLTTESATDTASLGNGPSSRALGAAVSSLGKAPGSFEIADAYDPSGALGVSILGFRVPGVDPAKLRPVILDAWLAVNTPGVKTSSVTLSGTTATKVSYGDGGTNAYVLIRGDSLFLVETKDESLAAKAIAAIAPASPAPEPS